MPKTPSRDPKYRKHKTSGQARATIAGKDYYFGKWNSPESKEAYHRFLAQWRANNCTLPEAPAEPSLNEIIVAYWCHAQEHYRKDGADTRELHKVKSVLGILRTLYGTTTASRFGPLALKAVRQKLIEAGGCRNTVNGNVQRVKRVFKWATENELVSPSVFHGLQSVAGLRRGRSGARESEPVRPVPQQLLQSTREHATAQVKAMIDLQLFSGMRPGEVCIMRGCDLETSGHVWVYRPAHHKNEQHDQEREIYLGPRAQAVLKPFLRPTLDAYLFSPEEADAAHRQERRKNRKTPLYPSHARRLESKRKPSRRRPPGDRYDVGSYRRSINRACEKAFPLPEHLSRQVLAGGKQETIRAWKARLTPKEKEAIKAWRQNHHWHPHQLRHNAATNLRKEFGIELARIILGHRQGFTTEIYAEVDRKQAMEVMGKVG